MKYTILLVPPPFSAFDLSKILLNYAVNIKIILMLSTILLLLYILQCVSYRMKPLMVSQVHAISVPNECMKIRLDSYLSEQFSSIYTRSFLAQLCENNNVKVNNIVQSKSYTVKGGEKIEVIVDKPDSCVNPENITLEILYEDNDMIAVNKPSGMVVHPAVGSPNGTFVNALLNYLGPNATRLYPPSNIAEYNLLDKYDGSSSLRQRLGVVHRLDKGTSGVLLAGKSFSAVGKLANLFKEREVQKVYIAVCVGNPGDATIDLPIGRSEVNKQQMCIYDGPPGKPAVSHIKTLAFDGKLSVCLVHIETGR